MPSSRHSESGTSSTVVGSSGRRIAVSGEDDAARQVKGEVVLPALAHSSAASRRLARGAGPVIGKTLFSL